MKYNGENIPCVIKIINDLPQRVPCFENSKPPRFEAKIIEEAFHLVFDHLPSQFLKHFEVSNVSNNHS